MIVAIIQARMSSTRLPGKMMLNILGKPLIEYVLNQTRAIHGIDKIILATSTDSENDPMSDYVTKLGFAIFRGSELDVLDRYYYAAKLYKPDHVVRITGDCPLIDPEICSCLITEYLKGRYDHAYLSSDFAEGLDCDIFSFQTLKTMQAKAILKSEREHVTLYIENHLSQFKQMKLPNKMNEGHYRITVDEPVDFQVVSKTISYLSKKYNQPFYFYQVKKYLDSHPEVMRLNSKIIRNEGLLKSLKNEKKYIYSG